MPKLKFLSDFGSWEVSKDSWRDVNGGEIIKYYDTRFEKMYIQYI